MTIKDREILFLLKRCRKHFVKQWGEDDGFISRLDLAINQMETSTNYKHVCDWSGNCYDKEGRSICKKG